MSAKKVSKNEKPNTTTSETATSSNTLPLSPPSSPGSTLGEQHQSANKALDETKDIINQSIEETGKIISRNDTQSIKDYQVQTIQAFREIMDNYLQPQKEMVDLLQSTWSTYIENAYKVFYTFYPSSQRMSEIYVNTVNGFANNLIAMIKLVNNAMYSSFDSYKAVIELQTKEMRSFNE